MTTSEKKSMNEIFPSAVEEFPFLLLNCSNFFLSHTNTFKSAPLLHLKDGSISIRKIKKLFFPFCLLPFTDVMSACITSQKYN